MNQLLYKILHHTGEQINHSEAHRAVFICGMAIPVYLFVCGWCLVTWWWGYHPGISVQQLTLMAAWGAFVTLGYGLLAGSFYWLLRHKRETFAISPILYYYAITTIITCYLVGPINIITGVVFMNATLIGMLLFPPRRLIPVIVICITGGIIATILAGQPDVIRPLLGHPHNHYMRLVSIFGAVGYIVYETLIMASLVTSWRTRESGVKALSVTDPLTRVANRRHIFDLLEKEFADRRQGNQHLGLIMVDIDHFKRINDAYGHQNGDIALHATADALRSCLRHLDHIGRYGGEEFLILLPDTSLNEAMQVAERCRKAIAELQLPDKLPISLTASLGVTSQRKNSVNDMEDIIQLADEAMYEAKKQGRNRVVAA